MTTLKCLTCTDQSIEAHKTGDSDVPDVADAYTMAPLVQVLNVGGQTIAAVTAVPVCKKHRSEQLKPSRLAVA